MWVDIPARGDSAQGSSKQQRAGRSTYKSMLFGHLATYRYRTKNYQFREFDSGKVVTTSCMCAHGGNDLPPERGDRDVFGVLVTARGYMNPQYAVIYNSENTERIRQLIVAADILGPQDFVDCICERIADAVARFAKMHKEASAFEEAVSADSLLLAGSDATESTL